VQHCESGRWGECQLPYDPESLVEICNDGLDNDCDGLTDEDCLCVPGDTQTCGTDVGECVAGTMSCLDDASWDDECVGALGPTSEICDGRDNDCDGATDFVSSIDFGWSGDRQEPNDSCEDAAPLYSELGRAEIHEGDDWLAVSVDDATELTTYPTLYPSGDEDWYSIRAIESSNWCVPFTSQCSFVFRVQLRLLDIDLVSWAAQDPDDYRVCLVSGTCSDASTPANVICSRGSNWHEDYSSYLINAVWGGECGRDDSRDFHIQVYSPTGAACGHYQLYVRFEYDSTVACP
jgi:hypothetical protein